jgi:FAD binding domain-like
MEIVQPEYAGYVAWSGVVPESDLPGSVLRVFSDHFTFFEMQGSHILAYLIPDETGSTEFGRRRLNWVWYWNLPEKDLANLLTDAKGIRRAYAIPPGELHPEQEEKQRAIAESVLPPVFKSVLNATKEPFVQAIMDLARPQIVFDRTILMGMRPSSSVPIQQRAHQKVSRTLWHLRRNWLGIGDSPNRWVVGSVRK